MDDINTSYRDGRFFGYLVAAGAVIAAGSITALNAAGYAVPATNTSGLKVVGVAQIAVDNSGGADGAFYVTVKSGVFGLTPSGLTRASVGSDVFVSDAGTVQAAGNVFAGKLVELDDNNVAWVHIAPGDKATPSVPAVPVAATVASVAAADAGVQTEAYVQADIQAIATLANANKATLNAVIAALKAAGLMSA